MSKSRKEHDQDMRPLDCFAELVAEERPEGWRDLPEEEMFEADEAARIRATARWRETHPGNHHDDERWANR